MQLRPGQTESDDWIPAEVVQVSCDGQYSLRHPSGSPIKPALAIGIREQHLRGVTDADIRLRQTVLSAERQLAEAQQDLKDHQESRRAAVLKQQQQREAAEKLAAERRAEAERLKREVERVESALEAQSKQFEILSSELKRSKSALNRANKALNRG